MIELTYQHKYKIKETKLESGEAIKTVHFFDEHWYNIPEMEMTVASVTTKLGDILAKGIGFDQWLRDTGNESKRILKEAGESGSKLHNVIVELIYGNKVDVEEKQLFDKKEWKKISRWVEWYIHYKVKPIAVELTVFDKTLLTAGSLDFVCEIDGEIYIVDWKTGNNIYSSNYMQLSAYFFMYNRMIDLGILDLPKATKGAIVHIGASIRTFSKNTLNAPSIKFDVVDIEKNLEMFKNINNVWNILNKDKKPPVDEYLAEFEIPKNQILKVGD